MRGNAWTLAVLAGLTLVAPRARADSETSWAVGVSEAQKATATQHLDAGNAQFVARDYAAALATYREAIRAWDHPAIRFNIVRCLIQLDRPLEALENLKAALRYGEAPFEEGLYQEALAYEKLLAGRVSDINVACTQPGVKVSLDGEDLGTCPLEVKRRIIPGKHQVVGVGAGFLTHAQDVVTVGGTDETVQVTLAPVPEPAGTSPRTYGRIALIAGAGLVAVAGGLGLYAWSTYRGQFDDHCVDPPDGGAPLCDQEGLDGIDQARFASGTATVVGVVGVASAVVGMAVMLRNPDRETSTVTPVVSPTSVGVLLQRPF